MYAFGVFVLFVVKVFRVYKGGESRLSILVFGFWFTYLCRVGIFIFELFNVFVFHAGKSISCMLIHAQQ